MPCSPRKGSAPSLGAFPGRASAVCMAHGSAASSSPEAMRRIAAALNAKEAPSGVYDLARRFGAFMALRDLGMPESGLDRAAEMATMQPYPNPRPLERRAVRQLLQDAWEGRRPGGSV